MTVTRTEILQHIVLHYQSFAIAMIITNTHWRFSQ